MTDYSNQLEERKHHSYIVSAILAILASVSFVYILSLCSVKEDAWKLTPSRVDMVRTSVEEAVRPDLEQKVPSETVTPSISPETE